MQKISFILICIILNTQCSVLRKERKQKAELAEEISAEQLLESIKKQNITAKSFFIQKAEIEISNTEGKEKIIASIKYEYPDKYLVSLKSKTGIEGARIFISNDTILVNDRINRIQYFGSPLYLRNKYGITTSVLPVVLGDFVRTKYSIEKPVKCINGKTDFDCNIDEIKIKYLVDCKIGKVISATSENNFDEPELEINYNGFLKTGDTIFPGRIELNEFRSMTKILIRIKKMQYPWNGKIEFIPGNRYKLMRLL